ncbi:MAG: RNA repair transcriptional activator RtcR family protein [Spirochaetales bacterium]
MATQRVLLTFVGNRDPFVEGITEENTLEKAGPVLSLLALKTFEEVFIFCTGPEYLERAKALEEIGKNLNSKHGFSGIFHTILVELSSVIDYEDIYQRLASTLESLGFLKKKKTFINRHLFVLLDPGTPQIQTCWFLLVRSGELPATLLQGIPPHFAGGSYQVREVNLDNTLLPKVVPVSTTLQKLTRNREPLSVADRTATYIQTLDLEGLSVVGESEKFRRILEQAVQVAGYEEVSVLIQGETGTGKEIIARLIHQFSPRKHKPFVPVNCAALSPYLVESEFFGHVKGAFTGADRDRIGKFRTAEGGTIFLDEVGDLPLEIQPKLLRVLQEKRVQPVGSDKEYPVQVRILAATNKDLLGMTRKGAFRRDLYDRLNQVTLHLPPLREREQDIQILAGFFLKQWNQRYKEEKHLSPEVLQAFYDYSWPGNVRELQNTIIALCASARSELLEIDLLPPAFRTASLQSPLFEGGSFRLPETGMDLKTYLNQVERAFYSEALRKAKGNRERAASLLGLQGAAFRKALKERYPELLRDAKLQSPIHPE